MASEKPRRPTIDDVAARAGVSSAAVSFAVNGRPGVGEETRKRILAAAEELGWRPSASARALDGGAGAGDRLTARALGRPARGRPVLRALPGRGRADARPQRPRPRAAGGRAGRAERVRTVGRRPGGWTGSCCATSRSTTRGSRCSRAPGCRWSWRAGPCRRARSRRSRPSTRTACGSWSSTCSSSGHRVDRLRRRPRALRARAGAARRLAGHAGGGRRRAWAGRVRAAAVRRA